MLSLDGELAYLDLLRRILRDGEKQEQRAELSDGRKPSTLSLFGEQIKIPMAHGFPLMTTKKMSFNLVVGELLWFLSGSTSVHDLHKFGVRFWDAWADADGDLGPVYGKQFRRFGEATSAMQSRDADDRRIRPLFVVGDRGVDQLMYVQNGLQEVLKNPQASVGRRILLTTWDPRDVTTYAGKSPLACHTLAQFSIRGGKHLDCHLYMRSADVFLGVPYNIASYALLSAMLARSQSYALPEPVRPRTLTVSFGDVHIYDNHLEQVREQIRRTPLSAPWLAINSMKESVLDYVVDDFALTGYAHLGSLPGEVAV